MEERLLLEATGVGVDAGRVHDQARHVEVPEWRARDEPATLERRAEARGVDLAARARVHREHDGLTGRDLLQVREDGRERVVVVGRLGAVHRRDGVAAGLDAEPVEEVGGLGVDLGAREQRGVVHHVADVVHTVDDVLGREVAHCRRCRAEQHVGHVVGEHAVALLAHHAVERPQAGLDVRERDARARRREGRGERRVGVPVDEHRVGLLLVECAADGIEHAREELVLGAAVEVERPGPPDVGEVREQQLRHLVVVVLAGVDRDLVEPAVLAQRARRRPRP